MNSVNLIGNLTRDPEVRHTSGGQPVVNLGIAWNGRKKQGDQWVDQPHFFDVTAFGERFEKVAQYLERGKKVGVSGRLDFQTWETNGQKRSKVVIIAHDITFASNAGDGGGAVARPADDDVPASAFGAQQPTPEDDDIPF